MIPAILITVFFEDWILLMFGKEYSREGFKFLQILAVRGIFVGVNGIFGRIWQIKKKTKSLIMSLRACLVIGGVRLLMNKGLIGIGYGWIIRAGIVNLIYLVFMGKRI